MKALKYTANLLTFVTMALIYLAVKMFLESITVQQATSEYTSFGVWFWFTIILLLLIDGFTHIQMTYEKLLSKLKFFNAKC